MQNLLAGMGGIDPHALSQYLAQAGGLGGGAASQQLQQQLLQQQAAQQGYPGGLPPGTQPGSAMGGNPLMFPPPFSGRGRGRGGRGRKRRERDPNRVPRTPSAYNLFMKAMVGRLKKEHPRVAHKVTLPLPL